MLLLLRTPSRWTPPVVPPSRRLVVEHENRTMAVKAEDRTAYIYPEDRTLKVRPTS